MITQENITKQEKQEKKYEKARIFQKPFIFQATPINYGVIESLRKKNKVFKYFVDSDFKQIYVSHKILAAKLGISINTVKRSIIALQDLGCLIVCNRFLPCDRKPGTYYQSTNMYELAMTKQEKNRLKTMFRNMFYFSLLLLTSAIQPLFSNHELPSNLSGNKSYIYNHLSSDSNTVFGHNYQLLQKEWKKMEDSRYEDQPWFDKELKNQKEIRKKTYLEQKKLTTSQKIVTEDIQKTESRIPFVPVPLPEPEQVAESKRGAIDLFAQPGQLIKGASAFASILAGGKGFQESFD